MIGYMYCHCDSPDIILTFVNANVMSIGRVKPTGYTVYTEVVIVEVFDF